jgi:hypothetical protein
MTLHTQIITHEPVDAKELHSWVNEHLLRAPNARYSEKPGSFSNELDQGLDALMWVTADPAGGRHLEWWEDGRDHSGYLTEEDIAYYREHAAPHGYTVLHLDTAYGFSPAVIHTRMIRKLAREFFGPRSIGFSWYNEFTDEWHTGLEGLDEFGGKHGAAAENWFGNTVRPALAHTEIDPLYDFDLNWR